MFIQIHSEASAFFSRYIFFLSLTINFPTLDKIEKKMENKYLLRFVPTVAMRKMHQIFCTKR